MVSNLSIADDAAVFSPPSDESSTAPVNSYVLFLRHLHGLRIGAHGLRRICAAGRFSHLGSTFDELLLRVSELLGLHRLAAQRDRAALLPPTQRSVARLRSRPETSADEIFLARVAAAIDGHLDDEAFDVETLASLVAVGRSHLYRRLEALLGCSPAKLILDRRLERAAELLGRRAGNVSEVAFAVGFKTVSHFSQRFRERYGVPPSAYAAHCDAESGRLEHEMGRAR